jgi:hypothetical protein
LERAGDLAHRLEVALRVMKPASMMSTPCRPSGDLELSSKVMVALGRLFAVAQVVSKITTRSFRTFGLMSSLIPLEAHGWGLSAKGSRATVSNP